MFKKILFGCLAILLIATCIAIAGTTYYEKNQDAYWAGNLVSSQVGTGYTGTSQSMYYPYSKFVCSPTVVSGAATTAQSTITVSGSVDGTNFYTISTAVVSGNSTSLVSTPSGTTPYFYLRGAMTSHATNSNPSTVTSTIPCVAVH